MFQVNTPTISNIEIQHVLEESSEGVILVSQSGDFLYKNKSFKLFFSEFNTQTFSVFWDGLISNFKSADILNISLENTPAMFTVQETVLQTSQSYSCKVCIINPNENNRILALYFNKNDIDLKFLQTQRVNQIGKLASSIVHDLNNLLTPFTMVDILLTPKINNKEDVSSIIKMLKENALRASKLLKQILIFIRGQNILNKPTDVKPICLEIEPLLNTLFPKHIDIKFTYEEKLGLINANNIQIQQMLLNFCTNAKDAIGDHPGKLHISLGLKQVDAHHRVEKGEYLLVTVKDTGKGMSKEETEKIFSPFFSTKPDKKGTGIGLTTCLKIINNHQGFLDVESSPGKGSTFFIYLPLLKKRTHA